jgi:UDP-N-acetyl-D-glucosamine dehydrogenase
MSRSTASRKNTKINSTVGVIGLGYVGLPLAVRCAERGFRVTGFDIDVRKVEAVNHRRSPFADVALQRRLRQHPIVATDDFSLLRDMKIIVVCVPTPVDHQYFPDLTPLQRAIETIVEHIHGQPLVVVESTINPGVCEEVVLPIFMQVGKQDGRDFYLAHCPERINPGDPCWHVGNIPRVVGSTTTAGLNAAYKFYSQVTDGTVKKMTSIKEAEAVKIVENTFRDINIAYVNELAMSFAVLGINTKHVIAGAATKPFAFLPHYPSCGIGGHCIPVDPYYLIERAKQAGFEHKFLRLARQINNGMPQYTVGLLEQCLNGLAKSVKGSKVGVLGLAYKANIDDTRESPAWEVIKALQALQAKVEVFDPHVLAHSTVKTLDELLKKVNAIILVTNHTAFLKALTPVRLKRHHISIVIDGKNALSAAAIKAAGICYKGIGVV